MADTKIVGGRGVVREGHEKREEEAQSVTPPFKLETHTIYVRRHGSNKHGDGKSPETAFKTFQHAVNTVSLTPPPGRRFIIDVTGIGVENFPAQYCLPQIMFPTLAYQNDTTIPYFYSGAGLRIRALPQLASTIPAAEAVIGGTDGGMVVPNPDTNLIALQITNPRTSWTPANLIGKQVIRTIGSTTPTSYSANCVIYGVTGNNTLLLTNDANAFNSGPGVLTLAPGEQIQIVEQSATFATFPDYVPIDYFGGEIGGFISTVNSISFQGIAMTSGPAEGGALAILNAPQAALELCNIQGLASQEDAGTYFTILNGTVLSDFFLLGIGSALTLIGCYLSGIQGFDLVNAPQSFTDCVFDGCGSYATAGNGIIVAPSIFQSCLFRNSVPSFDNANGDAIYLSEGRIQLTDVRIDDAQGNAIFLERGTAYGILNHVTGAGNGASGPGFYGVNANDGVQIQVTDAGTSTVTASTPGQDILIGDLPVSSWSSFYAAVSLYDITAVSAAGATGTGTRMFNRT